MNPFLKEEILRQRLRVEVKRLRRKHSSKVIPESSLYKAFVEPFTDVLQAVNLAGQDFLNSTLTFLRMFITFNPEKHKELIQKHDERAAKIQEKWKPLMDRTDDALSTGDADIVALALAPQVWAVSALGQKAAEYGGGAASFLTNVGLGDLIGIVSPSFDGLADRIPSDFDGKDKPILDKISNLFLGGVAAGAFLKTAKAEAQKEEKNENFLREQAEKPDLEKDLNTFMEDSGLKDVAEKDAKELFDNLKDMIEVIDSDFESRKKMFEELESATNLEGFIAALDAGTDLNESDSPEQNVQKMKSELKDSVDKLSKSEEFIKQVKEETKKEEVSPEDLRSAAEKVIFLDAKKNMESELGGFEEGVKKYAQSVGETLEEMLPSDQSMKILKKSKSPLASEVIKFVENTKQKYFIT
tara:strand:- start:935 stop:2173 length:1239 start_codon:yes stop_codon:yes gene_type:complete